MSLLRPWLSHISVPRAFYTPLLLHFVDHHASDKLPVTPCCTRSKPPCLALQPSPYSTTSVKPRACTNAALTAPTCYPLSRQLRLTHRFLRLQPLRTWLVRAGSRKRPPWTPYAITEYSRSLSTVQQGCLLPPTQPNPTWFVCGPSTQQATPSPCSPITPTAHPSHWIDTVFRIRYTRLLYYCVLQDVYHSVYTSTAVGHITMSMYLSTCTVGHITSSLSLSNTLITPLQCHTHTQYTLPPPRKPPDKLSPLPSSLIPCRHLPYTHSLCLSLYPPAPTQTLTRAAEDVRVSPPDHHHHHDHLVHRSIRVLDLSDSCSVAQSHSPQSDVASLAPSHSLSTPCSWTHRMTLTSHPCTAIHPLACVLYRWLRQQKSRFRRFFTVGHNLLQDLHPHTSEPLGTMPKGRPPDRQSQKGILLFPLTAIRLISQSP